MKSCTNVNLNWKEFWRGHYISCWGSLLQWIIEESPSFNSQSISYTSSLKQKLLRLISACDFFNNYLYLCISLLPFLFSHWHTLSLFKSTLDGISQGILYQAELHNTRVLSHLGRINENNDKREPSLSRRDVREGREQESCFWIGIVQWFIHPSPRPPWYHLTGWSVPPDGISFLI